MAKLYKLSFLVISILLLALLMHGMREGGFYPAQLLVPVLWFVSGLVIGILLKPTLTGVG